MMKRALSVLALILLLSSTAFAWGGHKDGYESQWKRGSHGGDIYRMCDFLDLTDEQEDLLFDIKKVYRKKMKPLIKEKVELRERLGDVLSEKNPKKDKARELVKDMGKVSTRLHLLKIEELFDIGEILTPEQRKKIKRLRPDRKRDDNREEKMDRKEREK